MLTCNNDRPLRHLSRGESCRRRPPDGSEGRFGSVNAVANLTSRRAEGQGVDFRIGMVVAGNMEDPTASRDDIIDIARSLVRPSKQVATEHMRPR